MEMGDSPSKFASLLAHISSSTDGFYPLQCLSNTDTLTKNTSKIQSVGKRDPLSLKSLTICIILMYYRYALIIKLQII